MGLPNIKFKKQGGGLARREPSKDHISCLYFIGTPPTSWSGNTYNEVLSPEHAIQLDLIPDSINYGVAYFHIEEFFRIAPGAKLYVAFKTDETSVAALQQVLNGEIRQFAVDLTATAFSSLKITALQAEADKMFSAKTPASIVTSFDFATVAPASLPEILPVSPAEAPAVSVMVGSFGNGGIPLLGILLGAIAKASVHESILWIEKFNVDNPLSPMSPVFFNGAAPESLTPVQLEGVETKRYIFLRKYPGIAGVYFNNSHTCTPVSSDYAYIENVRTMDKAIREIYLKILPSTGAPVYVDPATGKLTPDMCSFFEDLANQALEQMERDRELSGYKVFVDPDQNILTTGELEFVIKQVPVGVVRQMKVKISYTTKID